MSHPSPRIGRIVAFSAARPTLVVLVSFLLAAAALFHATRHFAMTTDTAELISTDLPWRQREIAYANAFPSQRDLIVAVVDGATPELAASASSRLLTALRDAGGPFRSVRMPEGGEFFDRNGLLFLPPEEVRATTEALIRAQPFLGPLAADPSLRGVLDALATVAENAGRDETALRALSPVARALAETITETLDGRPAHLSWRALLSEAPPTRRETRRFLLIQPVLDYGALQPGAAATAAIRRAVADLNLTPSRGVAVHLTGPVPLADEEFGSLQENAGLVGWLSTLALVGVLWLATRSARIVAAILVATFVGLIITAGLGLLAVGRFNLISVAFIPLFVGLGVDFNIQMGVRYLAERGAPPEAVTAAGRALGGSLALAAAAIAAGLFAFLPTSYLGVAELGALAGIGMIVAFILSVTLFPALVVLLRPTSGRGEEIGLPVLAPWEAAITRHRRAVLAVSALAALASAVLILQLRFDFDPINLRSPRAESVSTYRDLAADRDRTPYTLNVLAPRAEADALAARLAALPEVARTVTLRDLVPTRQEEKLAFIEDAAGLLGPAFEAAEPAPPPTDADLLAATARAAPALRRAEGPAGAESRRLADALERLARAAPATRAAAADAVAAPLRTTLASIRAALSARPVTEADLPPDLLADWIATDGRLRIQVFPAGDPTEPATRDRFSNAVQAVAPDATGTPISIRAAGGMVVHAFVTAGLLSFAAVTLLLAVVLRRARDVALTMAPVLLSGLLTFATCAALDLPINFANIIALPLLFGIGVAFNIYFVIAWRDGESGLLASSLTRAVVFSAMTTATAFGALWLSGHPGTAGMGRLLMISLGWELLVTLLIRPALLARPPG